MGPNRSQYGLRKFHIAAGAFVAVTRDVVEAGAVVEPVEDPGPAAADGADVVEETGRAVAGSTVSAPRGSVGGRKWLVRVVV